MFTFPDSLTTYNVKEVQEQLILFVDELMENGGEAILLDVSQVNDIDTAGLQLLLSVAKTAKEKKKEFFLINRTEMLEQVIEMTGAKPILDKEENG